MQVERRLGGIWSPNRLIVLAGRRFDIRFRDMFVDQRADAVINAVGAVEVYASNHCQTLGVRL